MAKHSIRLVLGIFGIILASVPSSPVHADGEPAGPEADAARLALRSADARIRAERLDLEKTSGTLGGQWRRADSVEWDFRIDRAGWYQVIVHYALPEDPLKGTAMWAAKLGDQSRLGPIHATGGDDRFLPQVLFDPVEMPAGEHRLALSVRSDSPVAGLKVRKVELVRAREPGPPLRP